MEVIRFIKTICEIELKHLLKLCFIEINMPVSQHPFVNEIKIVIW